jgi:hypothetical protein
MGLILQTNWEHVAERWGLPLTILAVLVLALAAVFRKYIGPYIQSRMARADAKEDLAMSIVTKQLEKAEHVQETLLKDFRGAIEENNRVSRRVADSLDELLKRK